VARRIEDFKPEPRAHSNGSKTHRRRPLSGVIFGVLIGGLLATSIIGRLQWLNLAQIGWWGPPVIAAGAAGIMVGQYRRDEVRFAIFGGAVAGLISLWGVYAIVRISTPVLFVERSMVRVVVAELARLFAYAVPAGAAGGALGWGARRGIGRVVRARQSSRTG
jgi:hypothetical protein